MRIVPNIITGNREVLFTECVIVSNNENTKFKIPIADNQNDFINVEFVFTKVAKVKARYDATVIDVNSFVLTLTNFTQSGIASSSSKPVGLSIGGIHYEIMFAGVKLGENYIQLTVTMTRKVINEK